MAQKFKFLYTIGSGQDSTKAFLNPLDFDNKARKLLKKVFRKLIGHAILLLDTFHECFPIISE